MSVRVCTTVTQDGVDSSITGWILSRLTCKYTTKSTWILIILKEGAVRQAFELNHVPFQCVVNRLGEERGGVSLAEEKPSSELGGHILQLQACQRSSVGAAWAFLSADLTLVINEEKTLRPDQPPILK